MRSLFSSLLVAALAAGCGSADTVDLEQLRFTVSEDGVVFGAVAVGSRAERTLTVSNDGQAELVLRATVGADWDEAFDFSPAVLEIDSAGQRTLRVAFTPSASGEVASTLRLVSDDTRVPPAEVRLEGTGVAGCEDLEVSPRNLAFGAGVVGSSQEEVVELTNTGVGPLEVVFSEEDNVGDCDGATGLVSDFCVAQAGLVDINRRITVGAGQTVSLRTRFQPVVVGPASGYFTVQAAPECDEVPVGLSGRGVETGLVCDSRLDFGKVFPGDCKTLGFSCENLANTPAVIEDVDVRSGDPGASDLLIAASLPATLQEGDSVDFEATYCPTAVGNLNTRIVVQPEGADRVDVEVRGQGGGPNIEVSPRAVDFGDVATLAPARARFTIANTGFERLEIVDIQPGSPDLTLDAQVFALEAGEARTVLVELESLQAGAIATNLIVRSNDPDSPEVEVLVTANALSLPSCSFRSDLAVQLGAVEPGRSVRRAVLVENTGRSDCLITGLRMLPGSDPEVFLEAPLSGSVRLPAGETLPVPVLYAPNAPGMHVGTLELAISSRTQPFTTIPIEGTSQDGLPLVFPRLLDFTNLGPGCTERTLSFRVHNRGGALTITGLSPATPGSAFTATMPGTLPLSVPANGFATVEVRFSPGELGAFADVLRVQMSLGGAPVEMQVELRGAREAALPRVTERFVQATPEDLDLLLALDWTSGTNLSRLSAPTLAPLIGPTEAAGATFHVGAVSDRAGTGGVLVSDTQDLFADSGDADPNGVYQRILRTPVNNFQESFSQLLSAERALSWPTVGSVNAGFLRRDARFALLITARTTERSPRSPEYYVDWLRSLKGAERLNDVSVSAFAGPSPSGCQGSLFASASPRIEQVVQALGGRFEVYCDADWTAGLTTIGAHAAGLRDTFFLRTGVDPEGLEVRVDGVVVPRTTTGGGVNYTVDVARSAIVFSPVAVPAAGAEVDVGYAPRCP